MDACVQVGGKCWPTGTGWAQDVFLPVRLIPGLRTISVQSNDRRSAIEARRRLKKTTVNVYSSRARGPRAISGNRCAIS